MDTQPLILKSKTPPLFAFIFLVFFGLVWNGLTSVFVTMAVKSWGTNKPEIFLTLFMIPFVLVGLGVIIGAVFAFLKLFNPKVTVALANPEVRLGGLLQFGWIFQGKKERIESLEILLEAKEEATYRHGTSTSTDRDTFFRQEIIKTTDRFQISEGRTEIPIPAGLVPTLKSSNNRIVWTLRVRGVISRWPDVDEEFELAVLPIS